MMIDAYRKWASGMVADRTYLVIRILALTVSLGHYMTIDQRADRCWIKLSYRWARDRSKLESAPSRRARLEVCAVRSLGLETGLSIANGHYRNECFSKL